MPTYKIVFEKQAHGIIYSVEDAIKLIDIENIGNRGDVYKQL